MKRILVVMVVWMLAAIINNKSYAGGYLPLGAACVPGGTFESDGICAPGMFCFYDMNIGYGYCMSDCALAGDETVKDDDTWDVFGKMLPFNWSEANTGYLKAQCVRESCLDYSAGCDTEVVYACTLGYYGKSTDGVSGCTVCPSNGMSNVLGMGGFDIGDCYLPAGTSSSDATGRFTVSADCYYTQN